tara:strand:+ start:47579 stop:49036 length:1458 start_codon:yes stop_codon:yes gene_type:complete
MAYGVTPTGFKAKRYEEIFAEIKQRFETDLGIDIDRYPDTVEKLITNLITLPIAQSWSNTQTLQTMFDLDKAEGIWLDNLASFFGITRSAGSYSRGFEYITVDSVTSILEGEEFSDNNGNVFTNDSIIVIKPSSLTRIKLSTPLNNPSLEQPYLLVEGDAFTATATNPSTAGVQELADYITSNIALGVTATVEVIDDTVFLEIVSDDQADKLAYTVAAQPFSIVEMTSYGEVRYSELGDNSFQENTVVNFPNYATILSATNREPITGGSGVETDGVLRERVKLGRSTGKATLDSIKTAILRVSGVTTAIVIENDTLVYNNVQGIDEKGLKCIVKGGDSQLIANTIWDNKPAGIKTSGDSSYTVKDSQGEDQEVRFSRVNNVYIHANVQYSLYGEELSPEDIEIAIAEQVVAYGDSLDVGVDVIQGRIEASLYQNITGLEEVVVTIGSTVNPEDPTPLLKTSPPIRISGLQEANFSLDRVTVSTIT